MEPEKPGQSGAFKIDKRTDSNFHIWKQKADIILTYSEVHEGMDQQNTQEKGTTDQ